MKILIKLAIFLMVFNCLNVSAQRKPSFVVVKDTSLMVPTAKKQWWRDAKFGMFIHWGLYAIPGRGEWQMFNERIDKDEYAKLADQFNPQSFDAKAWANLAKEAGMKYMVLTAKHHDGYSLWDSPGSYEGFNSVKKAAKRDFIKEYTESCREAGLKVGIYYSPLDWRFPGFFFPNMYRKSAERMKKQTYDQVRELLTNYGKVDILWWDGGGDAWLGHGGLGFGKNPRCDVSGWYQRYSVSPYKGEFTTDPIKLVKMVRGIQPDVLMNPRSGWWGDFDCMESRWREDVKTENVDWEYCGSTFGGWGYNPGKAGSFISILKIMVKTFCHGGNFLLNVGPDADGKIPTDQADVLKEIGAWMKVNGEAIYGSTRGPIQWDENWGGSTQKDKYVYLFVLPNKNIPDFTFANLDSKIVSAVDLQKNRKIKIKKDLSGFELNDFEVSDLLKVIRLEVK